METESLVAQTAARSGRQEPRQPTTSDSARRKRNGRRLRRIASLLVNLPLVVKFSGGWRATIRVVVELWRARGLGSVAGWATTAVAHSRFLHGGRYAAWSRQRPTPSAGAGSMLVVCSTLGVPVDDIGTFLGLLQRPRQRRVDLLLAVDASAPADVGRAASSKSFEVVAVPNLTIDTLLELAQDRCGRYDFVALPAPGCLAAVDVIPPPACTDKDIFYGDEDRIDTAGRRSKPFLKPDFSPDLLTANDYFGCVIVPRSMLQALPADPLHDYHSLTLRFVEMARRIERLDLNLAHRFAAADDGTAPAYLPTFLANRYGDRAKVHAVAGRPLWHCAFGNEDARVSVIVPTRDRLALLRDCVEGLFATNDGDFEVIVLDNDSVEEETLAWLDAAAKRWDRLRVLPAPGAFNWSRLNNLGIAQASGDAFVFLNNDTVPRCEGWLARLADVALRPDVGAVGALLLYPSGRIQHAGVVIGEGRWTDHIYRGDYPHTDDHVFVAPRLPRNVAAVTGACMAFSRASLDKIGLFNENYAVAGNDVEICVRALRHGLYNVYLPDVVLLHLESQSRGRRDPLPDVARLEAYLAEHCPEDPFFNRHLASAPLYFTQRSAA